jgi:hypothetical protein
MEDSFDKLPGLLTHHEVHAPTLITGSYSQSMAIRRVSPEGGKAEFYAVVPPSVRPPGDSGDGYTLV